MCSYYCLAYYFLCNFSGLENELEPPREMPDLPKLMNLESFRNAILERFNERLGIDAGAIDFPYRLDDNCIDDNSSRTSENSSRPSRVSSNFKFIGDYADPAEVIKRTPDFDSVILLLHEVGFFFFKYKFNITLYYIKFVINSR